VRIPPGTRSPPGNAEPQLRKSCGARVHRQASGIVGESDLTRWRGEESRKERVELLGCANQHQRDSVVTKARTDSGQATEDVERTDDSTAKQSSRKDAMTQKRMGMVLVCCDKTAHAVARWRGEESRK